MQLKNIAKFSNSLNFFQKSTHLLTVLFNNKHAFVDNITQLRLTSFVLSVFDFIFLVRQYMISVQLVAITQC